MTSTVGTIRWIALGFATWLALGCGTDEAGAPPPSAGVLQISFEAVPGNGFDVGGKEYDTSMASYVDKAALTADVLADVVPGVVTAVGVDASGLEQQLTPGGFELATSPSLQIRGEMAVSESTELAAALGYTAYQWSVLVTDFRATDGGTGFGTVRFEPGRLTPTLAQAFFEHAGSVDPGLGGGYTSFGDDMIFLNLRDDQGAPYSGLDDEAFGAALETAVSTFTDEAVTVAESGRVEAWLIGNDWTGSAPDGEDYTAIIDDAEEPALEQERTEYLTILEAAAAMYGWEAPPM